MPRLDAEGEPIHASTVSSGALTSEALSVQACSAALPQCFPSGKSGRASTELKQLLLQKGTPFYSNGLTKEAFVPNTHKSQTNISVLTGEDSACGMTWGVGLI